MSISVYDNSVPLFIHYFDTLDKLLVKAEDYAKTKGFDPEVLLNFRMSPDMLPFTSQIQIASDIAKNFVARIIDKEPVKMEDNEKTIADLRQRIAKTVEVLKAVKPEDLEGSENNLVKVPRRDKRVREFSGKDYLNYFAIPNFYFHVTAAYLILRHNGLELGKRDFLNLPKFIKG